MKRNIYLKTKSVIESLNLFLDKLNEEGFFCVDDEKIQTVNSLNRITSEPIFAKCSSPLYNSAAMDGIAVITSCTKEARDTRPIILTEGRDYVVVDTGDPIKSPYDGVIMVEDVVEVGEGKAPVEASEGKVSITKAVPMWQHVRPLGEDIAIGEMLLPRGHKIRPVDIGALLAGGVLSLNASKKPKVSIIPTGTEIIQPTQSPKEGDIIDSNSSMFSAMVEDNDGIPIINEIVPDNYELIKSAILKQVALSDIVLVIAGSSAGREDYTRAIIEDLGKVIVHGVSMKPGKPVILGVVKGKAVIGLPGYPVSGYLAFQNFVLPVLNRLKGIKNSEHNENNINDVDNINRINSVRCRLSMDLISSLKHREYVRVRVGKVENGFVASPLARGAGAAMSLVKADGFCVIPQNLEGYKAGDEVLVELIKDIESISNTLVSIGSHDMMMDIASDLMSKEFSMTISSSHVGSMGGLLALKRGDTIIAPTHLLNESDGTYNISYLKEIFPDEEMALIKGVKRIQGIMVKKGNPKGIMSLEDLVGISFVNRQRGAGTRVLLDFKLNELGIDKDKIYGYDKEVNTHMAVAALVASDEVDAGIGIQAAADALDLDFIPIGEEEYDLAIRKKNLESPLVKAFIQVLKSNDLKKKLDSLGGYNTAESGIVVPI